MAATTVVIGRVAPRSQPAALLVRGVPVQPTRTPIAGVTPLGAAVREACTAILAGELQPCRWCESIALLARIDADPHGYNDLTDLDIPL